MPHTNEIPLLRKFGKRLSQLRKQRGFTQAQLAEAVDMSVVAIAYIETGKRWVRIGTLKKISDTLDVSLKDMFDF